MTHLSFTTFSPLPLNSRLGCRAIVSRQRGAAEAKNPRPLASEIQDMGVIETTSFLLVPALSMQEISSAPRVRICSRWNSFLTNRSRTETIRSLHRILAKEAAKYFGAKTEIHIWQLDSSDQPCLFVSGLLAIRNGRFSRPAMNRLNDELLPLVTCDQELLTNRFLVAGELLNCAYPTGEIKDDDEAHEEAHDITLQDAEQFCDHASVQESLMDGDEVLVKFDSYARVDLDLPFRLCADSPSFHLRFAEAKVRDEFENRTLWNSDAEILQVDVLAVDDNDVPEFYLTGQRQLLDGEVSSTEIESTLDAVREEWSERRVVQNAPNLCVNS